MFRIKIGDHLLLDGVLWSGERIVVVDIPLSGVIVFSRDGDVICPRLDEPGNPERPLLQEFQKCLRAVCEPHVERSVWLLVFHSAPLLHPQRPGNFTEIRIQESFCHGIIEIDDGRNLVFDRVDQLLMISPRQIRAPDRTFEQSVSGQEDRAVAVDTIDDPLVGFKEERQMPGRMSGSVVF